MKKPKSDDDAPGATRRSPARASNDAGAPAKPRKRASREGSADEAPATPRKRAAREGAADESPAAPRKGGARAKRSDEATAASRERAPRSGDTDATAKPGRAAEAAILRTAGARRDAGEERPDVPKGDEQAGGTHWRFETAHGPVHVWIPQDYDPVTAGVVVYVHGLFTTIDPAWTEHKLADQFAASRKNSLFIACEAPQSGDEQPFWDSLSALLDSVTAFLRTANELVPQVPDIVVVGHSGAYRTLVLWLDEPIRHLVLLDALYGNEDEFARWIEASKPAVDGRFTRQLTIVADDTYRWVEPFVRRFDDVVTRMQIPELASGFSGAEQRARILYVMSQYGHMQLVTEGNTIPVLLRQTALPDIRPPVRRRTVRR